MKIKNWDSLRPGSREMERSRWEGQNFQLESSAPGRRRKKPLTSHTIIRERINALPDDGVTAPKHVGTVLM